MDRAPRPGGRIVELVNLPTRLEAEIVLVRLEEAGIQAMGKFGDADGVAPHFAMIDGYRVCVFDTDLDVARAVLDEVGEPDEQS